MSFLKHWSRIWCFNFQGSRGGFFVYIRVFLPWIFDASHDSPCRDKGKGMTRGITAFARCLLFEFSLHASIQFYLHQSAECYSQNGWFHISLKFAKTFCDRVTVQRANNTRECYIYVINNLLSPNEYVCRVRFSVFANSIRLLIRCSLNIFRNALFWFYVKL